MTEKGTLEWIVKNLGEFISPAIENTIYTMDWIAAMTYRETGFLIIRYVNKNVMFYEMHSLMKGDYIQRKGEKEKSYHGFGYMQIDIGSYPDFVKSGDWKDPVKLYKKAVSVLEEKRNYLEKKLPHITGDTMNRCITAAYNCGAARVVNAINTNKFVDYYTHQKNYSDEVWRLRQHLET